MQTRAHSLIRTILGFKGRDAYGSFYQQTLAYVWAFVAHTLKAPVSQIPELIKPLTGFVAGYNQHKIKDPLPVDEFYSRTATLISDIIEKLKLNSVTVANSLKSEGANAVLPRGLQVLLSTMLLGYGGQAEQPLVDEVQLQTLDTSFGKGAPKTQEKSESEGALMQEYLSKSFSKAEEEAKAFEAFRKKKQEAGTWEPKHARSGNRVTRSYVSPKLVWSNATAPEPAPAQAGTTTKPLASTVDVSKLPASSQALQQKKQQMTQDAQQIDQLAKSMEQIEKKL